MKQEFATTKMSSRGQVVIPEYVRSAMGLEPGSKFIVMWHDDVVMLKVISPPSMEEFEAIHEKLQQQVKEAGLKPEYIKKSIEKVRKDN